MANTFKVRFEGLICHVGSTSSKKRRAVLVYAPSANPLHNHVPRLVVQGTPYPLQQHDSITFTGLSAGDATAQSDFTIRVPGLERLLVDGTIDPAILNGDPHAQAAATVRFAAGTLAAPKAHQHRIRFTFSSGDEESRCVATMTEFASLTDAAEVEIVIAHRKPDGSPDGGPTVIRTAANSMIDVTNLPQKAGGNHFAMFRGLTDASAMAAVSDDGSSCPGGGEVAAESSSAKFELTRQALIEQGATQEEAALATTNPECSNSAWP